MSRWSKGQASQAKVTLLGGCTICVCSQASSAAAAMAERTQAKAALARARRVSHSASCSAGCRLVIVGELWDKEGQMGAVCCRAAQGLGHRQHLASRQVVPVSRDLLIFAVSSHGARQQVTRNWRSRTGQDRTGQDRTGQDRDSVVVGCARGSGTGSGQIVQLKRCSRSS